MVVDGRGRHVDVWIVDVDGCASRAGETTEGASVQLEQEIEQIVDSIQFEYANAQSGNASGPRSASCRASPGASSAGSQVYG